MRVSGDLVGLFTKALRLEKPPKAQFLLQFHIPVKDIHLSTMDASMSCSHCKRTLPLSSFLANASADLGSRVFATCLHCRERSRSRRRASQPFHLHNLSSLAQLQSQHIKSLGPPPLPLLLPASLYHLSGRRLPPRRT